jgi:hypothetical protein
MSAIIGIDPGSDKSAMVIWDTRGQKIISHIWDTNSKIERRLSVERHVCTVLAVEYPYLFGKKVWQQVIDTAFVIGRFVKTFEPTYGEEVSNRMIYYINSNAWRIFISGQRGAKDSAVKQAIMSKYGGKGTKDNPGILYGIADHEWDALSVCLYTENTYSDQILKLAKISKNDGIV